MPPLQPLATTRYLALDAGAFALALPLAAVRQILDVGGPHASAPTDPRALGVTPRSLAAVLGTQPTHDRPALLLFDGLDGPVLLAACALAGVFDAAPPAPLPRTVACKWPGLVAGIVRHETPRLALDTRMLMGLLEGAPA